MPCLSPTSNDMLAHEHEEKQRATIARLEAALCAVLTTLSNRELLTEVLNAIDYDEAGVTRKQVVSWFNHHKVNDAKRKARETRLAKKAKAVDAATQKLAAMPKSERDAMIQAARALNRNR